MARGLLEAARRRIRAADVSGAYRSLVPNDPLYKQLQWNLPLDRHGARMGHPAAGRLVDHRRGHRHRRGVHERHVDRRRLPAFSMDGVRYPALGRVDLPVRGGCRNWAPAATVSSRRAISSGTTRRPLDFAGHGTHVSGTIGQLTNNNTGTAGVAFNVRLMPVKVLASVWDVAFGCAERYRRHRRRRRARRPIRGRQRREGPQHESRPGRAVRIARRSWRTPSNMPSARACFVAVAAGNEFEDGNPVRSARRNRLARPGRRVGRGGRSAEETVRSTRAPGRGWSCRRPAGRIAGSATTDMSGSRRFDFDFTDTFAAAAGAVHGAALRRDRVHRRTWGRRRPRRTSRAWRRC